VTLPKSVPPAGPVVVTVSGGTVEVQRGLTWGELQRCRSIGEGIEADAYSISCATGVPIEEARAWVTDAIIGDVQAVIAAVFKLSGAGEAARFQR